MWVHPPVRQGERFVGMDAHVLGRVRKRQARGREHRPESPEAQELEDVRPAENLEKILAQMLAW